MGCIIAPTAVRRVTSASPTPMTTTESPISRIACILTNDPRLIIGASAIPAHVAKQAGFPEKTQKELAAAAIEACQEAFRMVGAKSDLQPSAELSAASFPDRLEISVELLAATPTSKPPSKSSAKAATRKNRETLDGLPVDEVQQETRDGRACITLVKYSAVVRSRSEA
jgi:hypothetical protein